MPLAASRSRSWTIAAIRPLASGPFQLVNGWMAPYSRGGALKFAATSRSEGTVTCCQGRWAGRTNATKGNTANVVKALFIEAPEIGLIISSFRTRQIFSQPSQSFRKALRAKRVE